jgi:DnaJ family protein C protein 11
MTITDLTDVFRINRLGQKMALPILLSQNLNPYVVLGSTVLPALSFVALHHLYLQPRRKGKIEGFVATWVG